MAIWWEEPPASSAVSGWYTAKVFDPIVEHSTQHIFKYDSDNSVFTHELMPRALQNAVGNAARWAPAPPALAPACLHPGCGAATKGGTGAGGGVAAYAYAPLDPKVARLSYTCDKCDRKCTARNPATLARSDPHSPRVTEDLDCRPSRAPRAPAPTPAPRAAATRQSPRLAALAPDAGGQGAAAAQMANAGAGPPPPPPPRPSLYREGADPRPCVADAVLSYHNATGLGAPGAGKAYLRDVALRLSDVHAISETSWSPGQIKVLTEMMDVAGHRLWATSAKTRSEAKSGTAILVRSTIPARPGDGQLWAKPDGKALAVALTIGDRPVILLAAHLPHTNAERIAFLEEVAEQVERAATAHALTPEGTPWALATYLWVGDLNLTRSWPR